jgi:phosphoribosyl 1,2-cyclic phosphodiesterase
MKVTFWGVRGSFPVSLPQCAGYGGNTPCLEVNTNSCILIDAGTGIRAAGKSLVERGVEQIHLLLSHTHWDHIQGFPYFAPLYKENTRIEIYSLGRRDHALKDVFAGQQQPSFFPVPLDGIKAELVFTELEDGQHFAIEDTEVLCRRLNHPGVAGGFRLEHDGHALAYLSDVDFYTNLLLGDDLPAASGQERQQWLQHLRNGVRDLAHRTDLMVFDTFFLPEEYEPDWGHSRPDDALEVGLEAQVEKIALFHHEPHRSDEKMDELVAHYQEKTQGTVELIAAREGLELIL